MTCLARVNNDAHCVVDKHFPILLPRPASGMGLRDDRVPLDEDIRSLFTPKDILYECSISSSRIEAHKRLVTETTSILRLPKMIVFQLLNPLTDVAPRIRRSIPLQVDLGPFCVHDVVPPAEPAATKYLLVSVGHALTTFRHYVASVLKRPANGPAMWVRCDDTRLSPLPSWSTSPTAHLMLDDAMMLFYEQIQS